MLGYDRHSVRSSRSCRGIYHPLGICKANHKWFFCHDSFTSSKSLEDRLQVADSSVVITVTPLKFGPERRRKSSCAQSNSFRVLDSTPNQLAQSAARFPHALVGSVPSV